MSARHRWFHFWRRGGATLACTASVLAALLLFAPPVVAEDEPVDLELIFAVDVSRSMDLVEAQLQREGYAQAITHPDVLRAIADSGFHGRIAVAYVEWAGSPYQRVLVDWTVVDGAESATEFADQILNKPFVHEFRTSISTAITFATDMFDGNGYAGLRRVIDVSGDGANNMGIPVLQARARAVERGITINGLPIMTGRMNPFGWFTIENLDQYYADCVIGGPSAFQIPIRERDEFIEAIRRKMLLEIAGLTPPRPSLIVRAEAPADCLAGERQWDRFMRDRYWYQQ